MTNQETNEQKYLHEYKCGHLFEEKTPPKKVHTGTTKSCLGKKSAYDFQVEGLDFIAETDFNCLIADPMGLGKTIQALLGAKARPDLFPILILVKSSTIYQWQEEIREWFDPLPFGVFIIQGSKSFIPPGFKIYLCSMDTLSRMVRPVPDADVYHMKSKAYFGTGARCKFTISEDLFILGIKAIICDESHSFKNPESARSAALQAIIEVLDIKHKIFLSGTPIKNRADEYFVPLNLLKPDIFTSLKRFRQSWLSLNPNTNKYDRVLPYRQEKFKELLSTFVIRREKNQVLKNLPPFRRTFSTINIEDQVLKDLHNKELKKLQETVDEKEDYTFFDVETSLMTLRRITGLGKIPFVAEYVDMFFEENENEKLAIGVHHKAVRDDLFYRLTQKGFNPLKLSGEDSPEKKNWIVQESKKPERRVLICNILAGGVGLNLQHINNALIVERQWNAADEEQFEGRFYRDGQTLPVDAEYMISNWPCDKYFSEMVEQKRMICGEILDGWNFSTDTNALKDLVENILSRKV